MAKKATKKTAVKKVTKKKVTKPTKKKTTKAVKKTATKPKAKGVSVSKFSFEPISHPKFSELVVFTKAPSWAKDIVGKRYLNPSFATKMINTLTAERVINSGKKAAKKEVDQLVGEEIIQTTFEPVNTVSYDAE
jgi:hypothetical protein